MSSPCTPRDSVQILVPATKSPLPIKPSGRSPGPVIPPLRRPLQPVNGNNRSLIKAFKPKPIPGKENQPHTAQYVAFRDAESPGVLTHSSIFPCTPLRQLNVNNDQVPVSSNKSLGVGKANVVTQTLKASPGLFKVFKDDASNIPNKPLRVGEVHPVTPKASPADRQFGSCGPEVRRSVLDRADGYEVAEITHPDHGQGHLEIILQNELYTTRRHLNEGTFGTVYLTDCPNTKLAVLKLVRLDRGTQCWRRTVRETVEREIEVLKKCRSSSHSYIIQLEKSFIASKTAVLVFEDGGLDLLDFLEAFRERKGNLFNALRWLMEQMLLGVNELHEAGYIHGDVKPENFVILHGCVKLIDLGFTMKKIEGQKLRGYGTRGFMAPELYSKTSKISDEIDIFALGASWYNILFDAFPVEIEEKDHIEIAHKGQGTVYTKAIEVPKSTKWNEPVNGHLRKMLMDCLQLNPVNRPSCQDLLSPQNAFLRPESSSALVINPAESELLMNHVIKHCVHAQYDSPLLTENDYWRVIGEAWRTWNMRTPQHINFGPRRTSGCESHYENCETSPLARKSQ